MNDFKIMRCTKKEYPSFLKMLNSAFDFEQGYFQKLLPHCTPPAQPESSVQSEIYASENEIARHLIAVKDNDNSDEIEVLGSVGAYPREWVVSDNNGNKDVVNAFGIGQVACTKEARGSGIMTSLMSQIIDESNKNGLTCGFLSGDRFRYGRFGFDYGAEEIEFDIDVYRMKQGGISTDGLTVKQADIYDFEKINSLYETYPSYLKRDRNIWERLFMRKGFLWYIGECDGKSAYICKTKRGDDFIISEIRGDVEAALKLLIWQAPDLSKSTEFGNHNYLLNPISADDGIYTTLWKWSAEYKKTHLGMTAIYKKSSITKQLSSSTNDGGCAWYALADEI